MDKIQRIKARIQSMVEWEQQAQRVDSESRRLFHLGREDGLAAALAVVEMESLDE